MNVICFHNPEEENGYLSNWYLSDFTINNIKFIICSMLNMLFHLF